jgi:hypothetical protein
MSDAEFPRVTRPVIVGLSWKTTVVPEPVDPPEIRFFVGSVRTGLAGVRADITGLAVKVATPVTPRVPAIKVSPVVSATVKLLVSSDRPPLRAVVPATAKVLPAVIAPLKLELPEAVRVVRVV